MSSEFDAALKAGLSSVKAVKDENKRLRTLQQKTRRAFNTELQNTRDELLAQIRALKYLLPQPSARKRSAASPHPAAPAPAPASAPAPLPATPVITASDFPFNAESPLEGIVAGLTRQAGGNLADRGVLEITVSGCLDPDRFPPKSAADLAHDSVFVSENRPDQWLCYGFKALRVRLTGYAIRSRFDGWANSNNLKSWVVEVSSDGSEWKEADRQADNADLNGTNLVKAFPLSAEVEARYVRLRQVGPAHSGKDFLAISGFELFGKVVP
jgi:hypothetical protein